MMHSHAFRTGMKRMAMLPTSWVRWNIVDLKSLLFYYYYNYLWYKSLACTIGKELVSLRGEHHGGGGFTSDHPTGCRYL